MNEKNASSLVYFIAFFVVFLAFCAFAVDAAVVFTDRAKLQEKAEAIALASAAEFNYSTNASKNVVKQKVLDTANETFDVLKQDSLKYAKMNVEISYDNKKVLIEMQNISQPYFLAFLGVSGITLEAKSCAASEKLSITSNYAHVSWLTSSAAYFSDIISKDLNLNDTAILLPLGKEKSASYDPVSNLVDFALVDSADGHPLSLGPGGFVTIKLPTPIIDKPGPDLFIKELGVLEGYFVFVGLDNNPQNPYVQADNAGDKISWINISCTGVPFKKDTDGIVGAYSVPTENLGTQTKFYGSGYFDLGATCSDGFKGVSMAKYVRIIDDNAENGFARNTVGKIDPYKFHKVMLYGEASTATPGADIDYVDVLNHVKLVEPSSYTADVEP